MSSHHIIREDQEPAIFIFKVENCWEILDELLEWSPRVLVEESYAAHIASRQTKIDGLLKNRNLINVINENDFQYTPLHLCKNLNHWLKGKNYTAINIFCDVDLLFDIFTELEKTQLSLPLNVFTKLGRCIIKPSSHFKKWYPKESKVACLNEHHPPSFTTLNFGRFEEAYPFDGIRKFKSNSDYIIILEKI